ncbi:MAG: GNAT family N-acetyltransferase [Candidatus Margulisiibacteriota bacterium]
MTTIKLRKAVPADSADILNWRNDPATVKVSFNQAPVGAAEHEKWFAGAFSDPRRRLLIAESERGEKIGLLRFDLLGTSFAEVSINLAPAQRGKGFGAPLIAQGCRAMAGCSLIARAKESNPASVKVFEKAGFTRLFAYEDAGQGTVLVLGLRG